MHVVINLIHLSGKKKTFISTFHVFSNRLIKQFSPDSSTTHPSGPPSSRGATHMITKSPARRRREGEHEEPTPGKRNTPITLGRVTARPASPRPLLAPAAHAPRRTPAAASSLPLLLTCSLPLLLCNFQWSLHFHTRCNDIYRLFISSSSQCGAAVH